MTVQNGLLTFCLAQLIAVTACTARPGSDRVEIVSVDSTALQETVSTVLTSATSVACSPNGKMVAISDMASGRVQIYDRGTGTLIKSFDAGESLSDSAARIYQEEDRSGDLFFSFEEARDAGLDVKFGGLGSTNKLVNAVWRNDSTVVIAANVVCVRARPEHRDCGYTNDLLLLETSLPSGRFRVVPVGIRERIHSPGIAGVYPRATVFALDTLNHSYTLAVACYGDDPSHLPDTLWTVGRYDESGRRIRLDYPMPSDFAPKGRYAIYNACVVETDSGEALIPTFKPEIVVGRTNQHLTPLEGIVDANDAFFSYLTSDNVVRPDSLFALRRLQIDDAGWDGREIVTLIWESDSRDTAEPGRVVLSGYGLNGTRHWSMGLSEQVGIDVVSGDCIGRSPSEVLILTKRSSGWEMYTIHLSLPNVHDDSVAENDVGAWMRAVRDSVVALGESVQDSDIFVIREMAVGECGRCLLEARSVADCLRSELGTTRHVWLVAAVHCDRPIECAQFVNDGTFDVVVRLDDELTEIVRSSSEFRLAVVDASGENLLRSRSANSTATESVCDAVANTLAAPEQSMSRHQQ